MNNTADSLRIRKAQAEADMAQWPQYKGHFDRYRLVRVTRKVKTKLGVAFEKGDIAIALEAAHPCDYAVTVYSFRNKCDTGLTPDCVEWLRCSPKR